jgi:hypothetical protein
MLDVHARHQSVHTWKDFFIRDVDQMMMEVDQQQFQQ